MRSVQTMVGSCCLWAAGLVLLTFTNTVTGFSPATNYHRHQQRPSLPTPQQQGLLTKQINHAAAVSPLFHNKHKNNNLQHSSKPHRRLPISSFLRRVANRFDTLSSAGFDPDTVLTQGLFGRVKQAHNPITYIVLALLAGFKWEWCFKSPYYWFAVAFCVKWYRARYVYKIPVWDRQPNWNNVITSKEQEKDLKAFTCKKCGSTIFIAKTREFFFEGNTGIGGLGCFSCGAKGKENFTMDRDRILEDVADMDDYFEYERPLDFVSRAERRKVLKEAGGDEEKANQLLAERAGGDAPAAETKKDIVDAEVLDEEEIVEVVEEEAKPEVEPTNDEDDKEKAESSAVVEDKVEDEAAKAEAAPPKKVKKKKKKSDKDPKAETAGPPKPAAPSKSKPSPQKKSGDTKMSYLEKDDLDVLGLDDF